MPHSLTIEPRGKRVEVVRRRMVVKVGLESGFVSQIDYDCFKVVMWRLIITIGDDENER